MTEVFAGCINCLPLSFVNTGCTISIHALIGPFSTRAFCNYSILRFTHNDIDGFNVKGAGTFPLNPINRSTTLWVSHNLGGRLTVALR